MRELEFRAWDKENECWLNFGYASIYRKEDGKPDTIFKFDFSDNYIVEQYTGLIDKNGKGIYEGDILLIPARKDKVKGNLYTVIWHKIHARFNFANKNGEFGEIQIGKIKRAEVIGNIHENPELLGGEE